MQARSFDPGEWEGDLESVVDEYHASHPELNREEAKAAVESVLALMGRFGPSGQVAAPRGGHMERIQTPGAHGPNDPSPDTIQEAADEARRYAEEDGGGEG